MFTSSNQARFRTLFAAEQVVLSASLPEVDSFMCSGRIVCKALSPSIDCERIVVNDGQLIICVRSFHGPSRCFVRLVRDYGDGLHCRDSEREHVQRIAFGLDAELCASSARVYRVW